MQIGDRIKKFRKLKNVTQEQLADKLNISYQAVSKWENSTTLPDITLIPKIADYFGVSCDALLTDNGKTECEEISAIIAEAKKHNDSPHEVFLKRVLILEDAVMRFPRSYELMIELAQTYAIGSMYPEWDKNNYQAKIIMYGERVYENCSELKLKNDAIQILCYLYRGLGNYNRIKELAEQMPCIEQCREALILHCMPGNEQVQGLYDWFVLQLNGAYLTMTVFLPGRSTEVDDMFEKIRTEANRKELWRNYDSESN